MSGLTAKAGVDGFTRGLLTVRQLRNDDEAAEERQERRSDAAMELQRRDASRLSVWDEKEANQLALEGARQTVDLRSAQIKASNTTSELSQYKLDAIKRGERRAEGQRELQQIVGQFESSGQLDSVRLLDVLDKYEIDPRGFLTGEASKAVSVMEDVFSGQRSERDPEAIAAFNLLLNQQINRGKGSRGKDGGVITRKEVSRAVGKEGRFGLMLKVYTDKTPEGYEAPLTQDRSSEDGDPVMLLPGEDIADYIRGLGFFDQFLNHPQIKSALTAEIQARSAGSKDPRGWGYAGPGLVYNKDTGAIQGPGSQGGGSPSLDRYKLAQDAALRRYQTQSAFGFRGTKKSYEDLFADEFYRREGLAAMRPQPDPLAGLSAEDVEDQLEALRKSQQSILEGAAD